jgi:hypothetical protein
VLCSSLLCVFLRVLFLNQEFKNPLDIFDCCQKVKVKITLRLAVYRQSVRLVVKPLEAHDQRFFPTKLLRNNPYVTSSLTRRRVCLLWLSLAFRQVWLTHKKHSELLFQLVSGRIQQKTLFPNNPSIIPCVFVAAGTCSSSCCIVIDVCWFVHFIAKAILVTVRICRNFLLCSLTLYALESPLCHIGVCFLGYVVNVDSFLPCFILPNVYWSSCPSNVCSVPVCACQIFVRLRITQYSKNLFVSNEHYKSRDRVVDIATGYGLGDRGVRVLVRVGSTILSKSSRPALESTQPPIQWVPGDLSQGVKRPEREADNSPPTSAEVKKMCIYTFTPSYAFMA